MWAWNFVGMVKNAPLKSAVSQEWCVELRWFFKCWDKFKKDKSCFNSYWIGIVKYRCGLLDHLDKLIGHIWRWTWSATITGVRLAILFRRSPRDVWKKFFELENEDHDELDLENKILLDFISNLQIWKHFFNTLQFICRQSLGNDLVYSFFLHAICRLKYETEWSWLFESFRQHY